MVRATDYTIGLTWGDRQIPARRRLPVGTSSPPEFVRFDLVREGRSTPSGKFAVLPKPPVKVVFFQGPEVTVFCD